MIDALDILYHDDALVAVNKPAGMLVHRSRIDRTARRFVLQTVRDQLGQRVYPVHRLDKPTSGVLLLALHPEAARQLGEAFAERMIAKTYVAVVRGYVDNAGVIDYPLKEGLDKTTDGRARTDKPAQPAVTHYRRLAQVEVPFAVSRYPTSRYALVELRPETGRKHQIRRHLKHVFHPIIGDGKYGQGRHNRFFKNQYGCHRLLLAATDLAFPHPVTKERLTITAPLDAAFCAVLDHLGWRDAVPARWFPPAG